MRPIGGTATLALFGFIGILSVVPAVAQETRASKPLDVSYITDDFFAAVVIHPARLVQSPALKALPLDRFAAGMKEALGIEPRQVEQLILLDFPRLVFGSSARPKLRGGADPPPEPFPAAGVVRFKDPVANRALIARIAEAAGFGELEELAVDGKKPIWISTRRVEVAIYIPDERTVVFANKQELPSMIVEGGKGRLAELMKRGDSSADILAFLESAVLRQALAGEAAFGELLARAGERRFAGDLGIALNIALRLLKGVESVRFAAHMSEGAQLRWEIDAASKEDAELLHDLVRGWIITAKIVLPAIVEESAHVADASNEFLPLALFEPLFRGAKTSRVEDRVLVQVDLKDSYADLLTAAANVVAEASGQSPVAQSSNNLKQLALAMLKYETDQRALPSHASYEQKGKKNGDGTEEVKPLLSWRVHILPYLDQYDLWKAFHHDEPWDSPHNKKLIAKMPDVFKTPGMYLEEGKTCYVVPLCNDAKYATLFPIGPTAENRGGVAEGVPIMPHGTTIASTSDGTANTLCVLEVPAKKAVLWTKPDDWEVDVKKPKDGLFGARRGFLLAALADGSVQRISPQAPAETLLRALGRKDGERYEAAQLLYQGGADGPIEKPLPKGIKVRPPRARFGGKF